MLTLLRDLRHGVRMLLAKPGFSATAVIVLALGIGANTAVFSIVNGFLLKPLLIQKPEELVGCYSRNSHKPDDYRAFSYPNYIDLRDGNPVFSSLMAHNPGDRRGLGGRNHAARARRHGVFELFRDVRSSAFLAGGTFTAAEERPGSPSDVVIVSYNFWRKSGSDPDLLGKTLRINSRVLTVIGITAEGFTGTTALFTPEFFMPLSLHDAMTNDFEGQGRRLAARNSYALILVGRLRPGVDAKSADVQLAAVASGMAAAFPGENKDQTLIVRPLSRLSIGTSPTNDRPFVFLSILLVSMASVVLLIASRNVSNMMLARGAARRKEIAIRLALGGGRRKILQQLFTEGLVLALAGGAAGMLMALLEHQRAGQFDGPPGSRRYGLHLRTRPSRARRDHGVLPVQRASVRLGPGLESVTVECCFEPQGGRVRRHRERGPAQAVLPQKRFGDEPGGSVAGAADFGRPLHPQRRKGR